MPFSVKILRFFGILLLSLCALGVAGMTWAYLIEPNLLFVRKVDYRVPQWKGKGTPVKVVIAGDLHLMPTAFDEVRALRYVQRIMRLRPDLILLVGDYARGSSENASMDPATAARLLKGLTAPCHVQGRKAASAFRNIGYDAQCQKTAAQTPVAGHPPFPAFPPSGNGPHTFPWRRGHRHQRAHPRRPGLPSFRPPAV